MATSETSICNRALQSVGTRSTIASLTEDSPEARNCNLLYVPTRDEVLGMAFWNFARKTATLGLIKSAPGTPSNPTGATAWSSAYPAPPWLYEYAYPSDCIQMRSLIPQIQTGYLGIPLTSNLMTSYPYVQGPAAKFMIATDTDDTNSQINVVLTNQYQAIGVYTMRITNPELYGQQFVEALVAALAAKLTIALTGNLNLSKMKFAEANMWITQARATDGNEGLTVIDNQADWIMARTGGEFADGYGWWIAPYSPLYLTI